MQNAKLLLAICCLAAGAAGAAADGHDGLVCCKVTTNFGGACIEWAKPGQCGESDDEAACHDSCGSTFDTCSGQCGSSALCNERCISDKSSCDSYCETQAEVVPAPAPVPVAREDDEDDHDGLVCCETHTNFGDGCGSWAKPGQCGESDDEAACHDSCSSTFDTCSGRCGSSALCNERCISDKSGCDSYCETQAEVVPAPAPVATDAAASEGDAKEKACRAGCVSDEHKCLDRCGTDQGCLAECGDAQAGCAADCEAAAPAPAPPAQPECCEWVHTNFGSACTRYGDPYCGTPPDPACKADCDRRLGACHAACDPDNDNCRMASFACDKKCGYGPSTLARALRPGRHAPSPQEAGDCIRKFFPDY